MPPCYSFMCTGESCETQFDTIQSMSAPFPPCPTCGMETKRVITSVPAVSLKGSGWAKDGYSVTDRGATAVGDKAEKGEKIVSFGGQKHRGRTGA